jgi:carboxypeptidase family protein
MSAPLSNTSRVLSAGHGPVFMSRSARVGPLVLVCISILALTAAYAQMNTGEITGVVKDPSGDIIAGATVVALNTATHLKSTTVTNHTGEYLLAQLPVGEYSLTVSTEGFKQAVTANTILHLGDDIRQDFTLEVGVKTELLVVEATAGRLQTESAEIKDVIENQQVVDLPIKDREFLELALLSAGVANPPGGTRGDSLQQTGKLLNILGQRTGHNLFLVDGVSVTDEYYNNVVLSPPPEDINEFNIAKTNYSAEFGGKSGGVINLITQSGANRFHGSIYEFLRNNIFDAKNFFDPFNAPAPPFRENQFGGALGGPIFRDKTFFFLNYDGLRIRGSLAHIFSVPTSAQRTGNIGAPIVNPVTGTPFPGNIIDVPLDPAAVALLAKVPLPNLPGSSNNLLAVAQQTNHNNQYNARLDHQFSSTDNAYLRSSVFDANELDPFGSSVLNEALLPGFGRTLKTHTVNLSLGETHTFSPNLLNELRFGFLRVSGGQGDPNAGNDFASQYGVQGTTANPNDLGYPQVSLSNVFSTMGDAAGFTSRIDRDFEFYDNVTLQHGPHTIQFGGYFFHLNFNPSYPNDARGIYTFSGAYSGNALADFLLGYPSQAQVGIGEGAENARTSWAHFYIQDGWRVSSSLKLEAGLRYEFNQNLVAQPNQTSDVDLSAPGGPVFVVAGNSANLAPTASAVAALSPIPVVSAASVGWNSSLLTPKSLRLSPRVGLAWNIPHDPQTVVRAGFGIYTNQAAYSVLQNLAENVPFFLVKTVVNASAQPKYTTENILTFNPTGAIGANGVNHSFAIEYNEVWNLAIQHALPADMTIEAEYVGSRTVHADSSTALNVPMTFGGPRPYPALSAFTTIRWDGWATFNGLTLKVARRFARGLAFDSTYTRSKSMDDASDAGTTNAEYNLAQNVYALPLEKALSSFDHRNRFTARFFYMLPFAKASTGWLHRVVGNWQSSGSVIVQSGAPFSVNLSSAAGQDVAHIGLVNGNNLERPNLVGDPNAGPQTPSEWFNTAAFVLPAQDTFGNSGRNVVVGPGLASLDLSLQKDVTLHEGLKLQFRCDAYNSLNHPNFDLPGRIFGASNFGVISSAEDPRELQFALKLMF